jgi:ATP-dependent Clp protease adapter protein ClpS
MKEETAKAYMVDICKRLQSQAFPQKQQNMMMTVHYYGDGVPPRYVKFQFV